MRRRGAAVLGHFLGTFARARASSCSCGDGEHMRNAAILVVVATVVGAIASPAGACLRRERVPKVKVAKQVDDPLRDVVAAEKALARGHFTQAARLAKDSIPNLQQLPPSDAAPLATRAQRTLAMATVRSDGTIDVMLHGRELDRAAEREANLAWAQLVLTYQAALARDNVAIQLQLAEALAADAYQRGRARTMLRDLSDRDVMPTAQGYAMLARLEGDVSLRDAALGRCRDLGGDEACKA